MLFSYLIFIKYFNLNHKTNIETEVVNFHTFSCFLHIAFFANLRKNCTKARTRFWYPEYVSAFRLTVYPNYCYNFISFTQWKTHKLKKIIFFSNWPSVYPIRKIANPRLCSRIQEECSFFMRRIYFSDRWLHIFIQAWVVLACRNLIFMWIIFCCIPTCARGWGTHKISKDNPLCEDI